MTGPASTGAQCSKARGSAMGAVARGSSGWIISHKWVRLVPRSALTAMKAWSLLSPWICGIGHGIKSVLLQTTRTRGGRPDAWAASAAAAAGPDGEWRLAVGDDDARVGVLDGVGDGGHEHEPDRVAAADSVEGGFDAGMGPRPEAHGVGEATAGAAVGDSQRRRGDADGDGGGEHPGDDSSTPDDLSALDDPDPDAAEAADVDVHEAIDVLLLACASAASASAAQERASGPLDTAPFPNSRLPPVPPPDPRPDPRRHVRGFRSSCCV